MKQALQYVGLWEIVTGTMLKPGAGVTGDDTWIKMNAATSAMILQCIKTDLVVKIIHLTSAAEIWTLFASEYSQVGSGSIMYWFSRLTRHMSSGGDISAHITGFQEATRYLANAKFIIPESVMAAILLSTLPSDPKDPESWDYFIKGIRIDNSTTLSSVISLILEEKRRQSPATNPAPAEAALAAREQTARANSKRFCRNCKRDGHEMASCWAPGGGNEGQGPKRRPHKKKEKGKEKANVADEGGDESSNVVLEKCLMAYEVTFSAYSPCETENST